MTSIFSKNKHEINKKVSRFLRAHFFYFRKENSLVKDTSVQWTVISTGTRDNHSFNSVRVRVITIHLTFTLVVSTGIPGNNL